MQRSFARQPELLRFLSRLFGPYPFSSAGGIVDDVEGLGLALETQTRPVYAQDFWQDRASGESADGIVVHELAHQWVGDDLTLAAWRHFWLDEGFASYAEWLWEEHEGIATAQQRFDEVADAFPPDDSFWQVRIGDPGPEDLFDYAVYGRGAMTLHALRKRVGNARFFAILRAWTRANAGGHVTTQAFVDLAERVAGRQLDDFFTTWLFTPRRPPGIAPAHAARHARARPAGSMLRRPSA